MSRGNKISIQNNFVRGLITEATELTFPEDACIDTNNCVFENPGVISRRLGFDFEAQFSTSTQVLTGQAITTYLWKNVAGEGDLNYQVVQIGNTLHFYLVASDDALSASKHADTIDLLDFTPTLVTDVATLECQYSSGNGLLFVTNENLDTFYVEYDIVGDTFAGTQIDLTIRDLEGDPDDTFGVGTRPTSTLAALSAFHRYNLENQGWTSTTLTAWDTAQTTMPSNSDVPWYFKTAAAFDFSTPVSNIVVGNSQAPRGHFIYNLYNINRSANVSGATDSVISTARVTHSAFFAGRVFYSGLKSTGYSSRIFFSQVVEDASQYGLCYQFNDPTSEQLFDALPTDGGTIDLIEAGTIIKMVPVLNSLIIFCTNGVWAISGSQGTGFTATDYTVSKMSTVASAAATSFVDVEGIPYWWTLEGIYTVTLDPQSNALRVVCISDNSIKTYFDQIPLSSRRYATGSYDTDGKVIQWLFRSTQAAGFTERYEYDSMLNYNLLTKAFYPWTVDVSNVKIHGITSVTGLSSAFEQYTVVDGADTVVDGADTVVAFIAASEDVGVFLKYLVSYTSGADTLMTWADNANTNYLDWETFDNTGVRYDSYFITGYSIKGEAMKRFQSNYISMYHDTDLTSKFKIRGQWNFTRSGNSGKWSTSQIVTNTEGDRPRKIKMRGHGTVCQFKVSSYEEEPFRLVGWAALETGNQWI